MVLFFLYYLHQCVDLAHHEILCAKVGKGGIIQDAPMYILRSHRLLFPKRKEKIFP